MSEHAIYQKLFQLRKSTGKKQSDVAQACHITRQTLSNYERGTRIPDLDTLVLLADYYHVSVDSIIRSDDSCAIFTAETPTVCLPVRKNASAEILPGESTVCLPAGEPALPAEKEEGTGLMPYPICEIV